MRKKVFNNIIVVHEEEVFNNIFVVHEEEVLIL